MNGPLVVIIGALVLGGIGFLHAKGIRRVGIVTIAVVAILAASVALHG